VEAESRGWPYWRFRPGAECPLREIQLESPARIAVLDQAARLLSTPFDPAEFDPVRFYLLHRPDGRDVFLLQYNHTLIGRQRHVPLILAIDRLCRGETSLLSSPPASLHGQHDALRAQPEALPTQATQNRDAEHAGLVVARLAGRGDHAGPSPLSRR